MPTERNAEVQIVFPVHNEAACVESVMREIYDEISPHLLLEFIACEDGSCDGTKEILQGLRTQIPIRLITSDERKGYANALIDGLRATTADFVLCLESDGQYSPADFWRFWEHKDYYDVSIGWRKPRMDVLARRLMSACFRMLHRALFHTPIHDPSCAFMLIKRAVLDSVTNDLGALPEGLQWEFIARVYRRGFRIREIPVHHRSRKNGPTKVFRLGKIPGIACSNFLGLLSVWRQLKVTSTVTH